MESFNWNAGPRFAGKDVRPEGRREHEFVLRFFQKVFFDQREDVGFDFRIELVESNPARWPGPFEKGADVFVGLAFFVVGQETVLHSEFDGFGEVEFFDFGRNGGVAGFGCSVCSVFA